MALARFAVRSGGLGDCHCTPIPDKLRHRTMARSFRCKDTCVGVVCCVGFGSSHYDARKKRFCYVLSVHSLLVTISLPFETHCHRHDCDSSSAARSNLRSEITQPREEIA